MYPVSTVFARGLGSRASSIVSTLGGRSLGQINAESGTLSWASDGRKVTGKLDMSVPDPHGTLAAPDGPLGWIGQQLVVRSGVSRSSYEELIPCGSYRIDDSGSVEQAWSLHRKSLLAVTGDFWSDIWSDIWPGALTLVGPQKVVRRGGKLSPSAVDLLSILEEDEFIGLEQPLPGATIRSEVLRLVGGRMPVASSWSGVADPSVPASVTYDANRLTAICSLAAAVNAVVWAGRSGELQFVPQPAVGATPVWTADATRAVKIIIAGNRTGLYNRFITEGTDANGAALRGVADVLDGPLAVGSRFGTVTYRHSDPLSKTQAAIDASAQTYRDRIVADRTVRVRITVPADPSLDPLDVVAVTDPEGRVWTGPVVSCTMPLEPGVMVIEIPVPLSAVMP